MEQPKGKKVGKLYGGHSFATGPSRDNQMPMGVDKIGSGSMGKGTFKTGPAPMDMEGHKSKGTSTSGTKGDMPSEDSGGTATGRMVRGKKGH